MIVYGSTISPFVRKVMVFLAEKGLKAELRRAGMGQGGPDFAAASPFGKMPAFVDGDYMLCDSTAICAYLDAQYPEPNLIPDDPRARGRAIWFEEYADTIVAEAAGKVVGNRLIRPFLLKLPGDEAAVEQALAAELPRALDYLEAIVPASGFLVEDRLTIADISVATPFATLSHLDVLVEEAKYPKAAAYLAGILNRRSFATLIAAEKPLVMAIRSA